jgi:hypothetical protein
MALRPKDHDSRMGFWRVCLDIRKIQVQRHQHAIFRAVTLGGPYQLRNPPYEGSMRILLEDLRFFSVKRVAES